MTLNWLAHTLLGVATFMVLAGLWVRAEKRKRPDCKTCTFNVEGSCRRYPPTRVYTGSLDVNVFPVVGAADGWFCGEYRGK